MHSELLISADLADDLAGPSALVRLGDAQWEHVAPLLASAVVELFASCDIAVELAKAAEGAPAPDAEEGFAAFIGLVGERFRGALLIVAPSTLVLASHMLTRMGVPVEAHLLADWHNELANQLAGRLKNKLMPYGIGDVQLSPPKCVCGAGLHTSDGPPGPGGGLAFTAGGRRILAHLDARADAALDFGAPVSPVADTPFCEGELEMF